MMTCQANALSASAKVKKLRKELSEAEDSEAHARI